MLLLIIGLTWCVSSAVGYIPPWTSYCPQQDIIPNACIFGNLTVDLFSKTLKPENCNSHVNVREFQYPPVIHINSTNTTDRFTVVMVDLGPEGKGPNLLKWMVTNVSVLNILHIPLENIVASYESPLQIQGANHQTLIQITVFRHYNVLLQSFGKHWERKHFSYSTLFSNTLPKLCGPVAGTQYWVFNSSHIPSAPPAPPQVAVQPVAPIYVSMVPVVPVGQAPVPASLPGTVPGTHTPTSDQHQHVHTTFHKKSSGSVSQPMQMLFIPLVVLAVLFL